MLLASRSEFDTQGNIVDEVRLHVGEKTFICLKNKLSERSEYFKAMFSHEFVEKCKNEIVLKDVDEKAFQFVLEDELPNSSTDVDLILSILKVSSMLQFDAETDKYEKFILANYISVYPFRTMIASFEMDRIKLYERSLAYSLWNFHDLIHTNDFLILPHTHLLNYLDNEGLRTETEEIQVFKSIELWSTWNKPDEEIITALIKTVRFNQLSLNELQQICNSPLVTNITSLCCLFKNLLESKRQRDTKCNESLTDLCLEDDKNILYSCSQNTDNQLLNKKPRKFSAIPCIVIPCNSLQSENNNGYPIVYGYNGKELIRILTLNREPFSETFIGFKIISVGFKLYLFGGEHGYGTGMFNMAVWSYDFISECWNYECQISQQRRHFAITVLNDCVYLLGGTGRYRKVLKTVEKFNMKTKEWALCTKLTNANSFAPAVCTYGNKIYIIDGYGRTFYEYDPNDNIFSPIPIELQEIVGLRFISIYQDYLYAIQGSTAKIYRWKIFNNSNSVYSAEVIGEFHHEGDSVLVNDCIYHFGYVDEDSLCYIEMLSLTNLLIQLVSSYPYKSSRDFQFICNGSFVLPNYF